MTWNKNLHWGIYILFLFSCARQSSPTGGPKDTIPPVLIKAIPPNEAINFDAEKIQLLFSEDVILNAPKEQLIVTPTIGKEYEITYRKNQVILEFAEPLEDSTTYTFSFRESIQDITEKNPVENLQLAYSTGDYIDSLSIAGTVYDLLKGTPLEDVTVALHVENDTFNILEHPATYFTKSDEEGNYTISHLKPDNYFVYAIQDKNRNLFVNSRSESYGYISDYQYLIEDMQDISIGLVRLDAGPLEMTSARPYNTYFNIRMNKNLRTFRLAATDSSDIRYTFGENQANIRLYDTTEKDSIQIHLLALDSIDNVIDTTLYAKFLEREVTPEDFSVSIAESSILAHKGQFDAIIQFTKPITEINFDSIYFQVDSLTKIPFTPQDITWDPLPRKLTIHKIMDRSLFSNGEPTRSSRRRASAAQPEIDSAEAPLEPINEFYLGTAAFMSVERDSSQQIVQHIQPKHAAELSVINIAIRTEEPAYIVQLIDNNYKIIRQVENEPVVRFEDVTPGDYQIRLIIDKNNNARWDAGNYFKSEEPEPVLFFRAEDGSTIIKGVKANWDVGGDEMFITY